MGSGLRCVRICPALVGRIMYGASVSVHGCDAFTRIFGAEKEFTAPVKAAKHVLILGGGFGGMKTAEHPEEELSGDLSVAITLVSDTHAFLFTPMLAEVAGGSLEPNRITTPLRGSLHRTVVVRGAIEEINLELRAVEVAGREIAYDQLVLALGAVSNYLDLTNIERNSLDFKTLLDAIRIRNRVIEMFERAGRESDPSARQSLMTFVIAGGGFAGVELAAPVNDFAHGILADYPNLDASELRTILVHGR